jgi:hypothetical protein
VSGSASWAFPCNARDLLHVSVAGIFITIEAACGGVDLTCRPGVDNALVCDRTSGDATAAGGGTCTLSAQLAVLDTGVFTSPASCAAS